MQREKKAELMRLAENHVPEKLRRSTFRAIADQTFVVPAIERMEGRR